MLELDNIRLLVTEFEDCYYFYKDALGFKVEWGDSNSGYVSFEAGHGKVFAIFDRKDMAEALGTARLPSAAQVQDRFALIFRVQEDIEEVVNRLHSLNIELLNEIQDRADWGIRIVHLRDPDGNLIEIISELPKDKWNIELLEEDSRFSNK